MKRFFFAVAVVALVGSVSSAEEKAIAPAPMPATPVVVAGPTTTYQYAPAQPQRRGLFARLRARNNTTTYSYSTQPQMTTPAPMPMPGTTPTPMPMPGVRPVGGAQPMPGTVVPATGDLPPGRYTATDGTIIQIGGTQAMTTTTSNTRTGLFGRLRNR